MLTRPQQVLKFHDKHMPKESASYHGLNKRNSSLFLLTCFSTNHSQSFLLFWVLRSSVVKTSCFCFSILGLSLLLLGDASLKMVKPGKLWAITKNTSLGTGWRWGQEAKNWWLNRSQMIFLNLQGRGQG